MKYFYLILMLFCHFALAENDPFDKRLRNINSQHQMGTKIIRDDKCNSEQSVIFSEIPLKQLKLVGIIFSNPKRILIQDSDKNLAIVAVNQLISEQKYKLKTINKNSVTLTSLDINCSENKNISLIL